MKKESNTLFGEAKMNIETFVASAKEQVRIYRALDTASLDTKEESDGC